MYRCNRRLSVLLVVTAMAWGCTAESASDAPVVDPPSVIAFASCLKTSYPAPTFDHLLAAQPDVLVMMGDNVYVDIPEVPTRSEQFRPYYDELEAQPYWPRVRDEVPVVLATYDDHDFGKNDAGVEWHLKETGRAELMRFFPDSAAQIPADRDGVYHSTILGPEGQRVQFIVLDTRWFRDRLDRTDIPRSQRKGGPYLPSDDTSRTLLGEAQWDWLEEQLRQPAEVRVVISSIQVVAREHGWECWGNFPHELERLYRLIGETQAEGVVFLSGDRHLAELSRDTDPATPYPMWDATSSGMNQPERPVNEPNRYRVGEVRRMSHFALLRVDWTDQPMLTFEWIDESGAVFASQSIALSELGFAGR
ncbi:MAG: alkaline phosphatase D family protein [Planctomycetota bacterium]